MSSINNVLNLIKLAILASITDKAVKKGADKVKEKVSEAFESEDVRRAMESFITAERVQAASEALKRSGRRGSRKDNPWVDKFAPKRPRTARVLFLCSESGQAICDKKYKKQWKATHGTECPISEKNGRPRYNKGELLSFASEVWRDLSEDQKSPFEVEASKAKSEYELAKKNHVVSDEVKEAQKAHKASLVAEKARRESLHMPARPKLKHVLFIDRRIEQLMEDQKAGDKEAKKAARAQAKEEWKAKEVDDDDVQQLKDECTAEAKANLEDAQARVRAWASENGEELPTWARVKGKKGDEKPPAQKAVEPVKASKVVEPVKASKSKVVEPVKASKEKSKKVAHRDPDSSDDSSIPKVSSKVSSKPEVSSKKSSVKAKPEPKNRGTKEHPLYEMQDAEMPDESEGTVSSLEDEDTADFEATLQEL